MFFEIEGETLMIPQVQVLGSGNKIVMPFPINMHAHFREGPFMKFLVGVFIQNGWRGFVQAMPNTKNPILTKDDSFRYYATITEAAFGSPHSEEFMPLMSIQITPKTTIQMLEEAIEDGIWLFKVYPYRVTTNSDLGVSDYKVIIPLLKFLEGKIVRWHDGVSWNDRPVTVMFHPESPNEDVEGLDKESYFIENELQLILDECPDLSISLEHISTADAVNFMRIYGWEAEPAKFSRNIVATVPIQYMVTTVDHLAGYKRESDYKACSLFACKPMPKRRKDCEALIYGVTSGMKCLLAGNDDAAHLNSAKAALYAACGTANTWASLPMTVEVFEKAGKLHNLGAFLYSNAAERYRLPISKGRLTLVREDWVIPRCIDIPELNDSISPWMGGETVHWKVQ